MKKINFFMIVILTTASLISAQDDNKKEIPNAVLNEFNKSYSGATVREIGVKTKNGKKYYEFSFINDKQKFEILYDNKGKIIELEETLDPEVVPVQIKDTIGREIPQNSLLNIYKITKEKEVYYNAKVLDMKKNKKYKLYITEDGRLIKKKKD